MFQECSEKHSLARCEVFQKMTPQQRLQEIDERELCRLCYCHLQVRDCWSKGRVPNCSVDGCEAPHNPLLYGAIAVGSVMIMREVSERRAQTHLSREDVRVEVAGNTSCLHKLYDWGASPSSPTSRRGNGARESETAICSGRGTEQRVHSGWLLLHAL
jgi:hypothetical protein